MKQLISPEVLGSLSRAHEAVLTSRSFFAHLVSPPFGSGLHEAFDFAIAACLVAAVASWSRGKRYVYHVEPSGGSTPLEPEQPHPPKRG